MDLVGARVLCFMNDRDDSSSKHINHTQVNKASDRETVPYRGLVVEGIGIILLERNARRESRFGALCSHRIRSGAIYKHTAISCHRPPMGSVQHDSVVDDTQIVSQALRLLLPRIAPISRVINRLTDVPHVDIPPKCPSVKRVREGKRISYETIVVRPRSCIDPRPGLTAITRP